MQRGFTLFETLIYLALFGFLIGGGFLAAYQIIESSGSIAEKTAIEAEADFIFRKIDWALNGEIINVSGGGNTLTIDKIGSADDAEFEENGGILELNGTPLTSSQLIISEFIVTITGGTPESVEVSFKINGEAFGPTKRYVR